jgi:hypothetical protein
LYDFLRVADQPGSGMQVPKPRSRPRARGGGYGLYSAMVRRTQACMSTETEERMGSPCRPLIRLSRPARPASLREVAAEIPGVPLAGD